ncbi:MAG TPA: DUF1641 domain-containing protein [Acidobacteriaceae bacterium]|jgi:uncharacterized protein YjgD (DUF1641 family)|nr:DUF1641 domain-containing protein [Acidobacteriaceae bacterium]
MANPLPYKPTAVDTRTELDNQLATAPRRHSEALLAAWELLGSAHEEGILDALHGAVYAKDTIFGTVAQYAKQQESVNAMRNAIALVSILGSVDPEILENVAKAMAEASEEHRQEERPPSLWKLIRRVNSEDSRRGLSFLTLMLAGLGRSMGS